MNYEETIETLLGLENRMFVLDTTTTRPTSEVKPEHLRSSMGGMLRLVELERGDEDRPVDEAAWWTHSHGKAVIRLEPEVGYLLSESRFRGASWDGENLVIELRAMTHRLISMVRADGEPVETLNKRLSPDERPPMTTGNP